MPHFFVPPENISAGQVVIQDEEYHHLINVCRARVGDEINVFDGTGRIYTVRVEKIFPEKVVAKILQKTGVEKSVRVNLFTAICKGERFSWLIEKSSELGVDNVYPLIYERSSFCPDKKWSENHYNRWQRLARAAAKQSGQPWITRVHLPRKLSELNTFFSEPAGPDWCRLSVVAWEKEERRKIFDLDLSRVKEINIFIGPEGGITQAEIELLKNLKVIPITLGQYILRVETAAVVCVGIFNHLIKYR